MYVLARGDLETANPRHRRVGSVDGSSLDHLLPEPFRVERHPDGRAVRVAPLGELDIATTTELEQSLRDVCDAGARHLILDLGGLVFIDSSGIHLVLEWDARSRRDGVDLTLVPGPPAVHGVFELCGLLDRLPFGAA